MYPDTVIVATDSSKPKPWYLARTWFLARYHLKKEHFLSCIYSPQSPLLMKISDVRLVSNKLCYLSGCHHASITHNIPSH